MSARFSEREAREALGLLEGDAAKVYTAVATDTRSMPPGALFVAIKGERFDGHDFLEAALEAGAAAALVRKGTAEVPGLALHEVDDPLLGYGLLARARRRRIRGPVVGITGTNGKTSTKEMLAAALATRYRTYATRLNLNNLIGVPQTILEAPEDTEALVVEAGASVPGEIARYRTIIEPSAAVVTNVAPGHLEGFGSRDAVLSEKLELVRGIPLVVVGVEPAELPVEARKRTDGRVVSAGLTGAEVVPDSVALDSNGFATLAVGGRRLTLPILGLHQAENAMIAWALAEGLGLDPGLVAGALERVRLPGGRGELTQVGRLTILNDCYNANPASFRAALATAERLRPGRRLVFVAGTMRELGDQAPAWHQEVAERLARLDPDLLGVVGDFVEAMAPWAERFGERLLAARDAPALAPLLAARLRGDELVVLKASRGVALERILPAVTSRATAAPEV